MFYCRLAIAPRNHGFRRTLSPHLPFALDADHAVFDPINPRIDQALYATENPLAQPNYRQQKKQRELAKKKKNDEKQQRKGRAPQPITQEPTV